jgi:hypothetical protein
MSSSFNDVESLGFLAHQSKRLLSVSAAPPTEIVEIIVPVSLGSSPAIYNAFRAIQGVVGFRVNGVTLDRAVITPTTAIGYVLLLCQELSSSSNSLFYNSFGTCVGRPIMIFDGRELVNGNANGTNSRSRENEWNMINPTTFNSLSFSLVRDSGLSLGVASAEGAITCYAHISFQCVKM